MKLKNIKYCTWKYQGRIPSTINISKLPFPKSSENSKSLQNVYNQINQNGCSNSFTYLNDLMNDFSHGKIGRKVGSVKIER